MDENIRSLQLGFVGCDISVLLLTFVACWFAFCFDSPGSAALPPSELFSKCINLKDEHVLVSVCLVRGKKKRKVRLH